jgi:DNA segregation ATPase FtsK/SpoIIIE, S-DNA-T family
MSQPSLHEQQRSLWRDLRAQAEARATAETSLQATFKQRQAELDQTWQTAQTTLREKATAAIAALDRRLQEDLDKLKAVVTSEHEDIRQAYKSIRQENEQQFRQDHSSTKTKYREARWSTKMLFEANKNAAKDALKQAKHKVGDTLHRFQSIGKEAKMTLHSWGLSGELLTLSESDAAAEEEPPEPEAAMEEKLQQAEEHLNDLQALKLPKLFQGGQFWIVGGILVVVTTFILMFITRTDAEPISWFGLALGLGSTIPLVVLVYFMLKAMARSQAAAACDILGLAIAEGVALKDAVLNAGKRAYKKQIAKSKALRDKELRHADTTYHPILVEQKNEYTKRRKEVTSTYQPQVVALDTHAKNEGQRLRTDHQQRREQLTTEYQRDLQLAQQTYERGSGANRQQLDQGWLRMSQAWRQALAQAKAGVQQVHQESSRIFLPWEGMLDVPPVGNDFPNVLRFGSYQAELAKMPHGVPADPQLKTESALTFTLPAQVPFPTPGNLMLLADGQGRNIAVNVLQTAMLRYLLHLPPSKVRLTIIDPVGLGENFAAFMHLADYDEAMISYRIWTESAHIEQRLTDLTGHMESIIQKYLRNQFPTIEAYNQDAGEVAEPFRVLVIANFPVNFTAEATRRLISIINSGARCGVVTLMSVDMKQEMPQGCQLEDLRQGCQQLLWENERFRWLDPDFHDFPLTVDLPPEDAVTTNLLNQVGSRTLDAKKVEVPFQYIAPPPEQWWTADSSGRIQVALGRVGATRRQDLLLGVGTSQHMVTAGKTGSGKSTLLHVLITNAALMYGPDQLELYLVDFKKGVEFKPYATHGLPHARAIAIESEREFGLSVLQRLDDELKRRGDRYRELGVQDLKACRAADLSRAYPRVLLIVDEFQEFFTEDDKLAQESAQLLDRLVRQGRAFGIHVILGSQTLGGAYSLARSTIDQMVIRVVLPCSEMDGHLILSEDNHAARLLSRPGEAIYNDASGLIEGNHPFQVAWLPDEQREEFLMNLQEKTRLLSNPPPFPIVFEGNVPANPRSNESLRKALQTTPTEHPKEILAWLGEPVSIKAPTAAMFHRASGSHLLMVGQSEEGALAVTASVLISLAAQHLPGVKFVVTAPTDDSMSVFKDVASVLPHEIQVVGSRDVAAALSEVAEEVKRRQESQTTDAPPIYLLLHGMHRLRDLRRSEDDYGFSSAGGSSPPQQLAAVLKEGPSLGVHCLIWCDSYNSVMRSLERALLREFDMKVLFQMSAGDSSNLIDLPIGSKLGNHRAVYYSEEHGKAEKFRPYLVPKVDWLDELRRLIATRQNSPAQWEFATAVGTG